MWSRCTTVFCRTGISYRHASLLLQSSAKCTSVLNLHSNVKPLLRMDSKKLSSGNAEGTMPTIDGHDFCPRKHAVDIFKFAVEAVTPKHMVDSKLCLSPDGRNLTVEDRSYKLDSNVYVVGFGKAVLGMARAVEDVLGSHIVNGVISIPFGCQEQFTEAGKTDFCLKPSSKIEVCEGAKNNLPDEDSQRAALKIEKLVQSLGENSVLIVLISGGGSALLPSPCPPITLQEEIEVTSLLGKHGATIQDLNVVRQNIEKLKGGGLAQMAKPAQVVSLILSDVVGDKLDIISSGPTVPELSSPRQCLEILDRLKVKDKVPVSVITTLEEKALSKRMSQDAAPYSYQLKDSVKEWDHVQNNIIGSNSLAAEAALEEANKLGYLSCIMSMSLEGEARTVGSMFADLAKFTALSFLCGSTHSSNKELSVVELDLCRAGVAKDSLNQISSLAASAYNSGQGVCIICGGETTVHVTGSGMGGRNQEMAVACSLKLTEYFCGDSHLSSFHVEFLSAGTDGQDGPTDAAGAVVDKHFSISAQKDNCDINDYLRNNDSYSLLKCVNRGDNLILTGLTGTNVMDIQVLIVKPVS